MPTVINYPMLSENNILPEFALLHKHKLRLTERLSCQDKPKTEPLFLLVGMSF